MLSVLATGACVASLLSLAHGQYVCGYVSSSSTTPGVGVALQIDNDAGMVYITLQGNDGEWFGAGFGNSRMPNTSAIIVDDDTVYEQLLGFQSPGTSLSDTVEVVSNTVSDSMRTVVLSRNLTGDTDDHFDFDDYAANDDLSIIVGANADAWPSKHSSKQATSITFVDAQAGDVACDLLTDEETSTEAPADDDVTYTCGSVDTSVENDMSVALKFDDDNEIVYITMTGPADQFFGAGFGVSNMQTADTYSIIVDANGVSERSLGARAAGSEISPSSLTTESDLTVGEVRTVVVSRDMNATGYYFDSSVDSVNLIWAQSSSSATFTQHGSTDADRGNAVLSITSGVDGDDDSCGGEATTTEDEVEDEPTTTEAKTYICGSATTRSSDDMKVYLRIDEDNSVVYITLTGPDDQWFGTGFGSSSMSGTYVIIVDNGGVSERELASRGSGTKLSSSVTKLSDESSGGIRTVLLSREIDGEDSSYYTFTTSGSISLIYGTSSSSSFEKHTSRGSTSLSLSSGVAADDASCGASVPIDPTGSDGDAAASFSLSESRVVVAFVFVCTVLFINL